MEAALFRAIDELAPAARQHGLIVRRSSSGSLELSGRVDIRLATLLNIAIAGFLESSAADFGLTGEVSRRKLEIFTPQARLGDVANMEEREVLAQHTKNNTYLDPNSMIDVPEWNADFVLASDRRHRDHIKPRYSQDDDATLDAVARFVASRCRMRPGIVVHTGAGISAAAGIATYREGSNASISMSAALPTYSHYALVALTKSGAVDYICSQNVDGLHRRSGLAADRLSELHGNSYIEMCSCCSPPMEFVRPYDAYSTRCERPTYWARYMQDANGRRTIEANVALTQNELSSGIHHITGRACPHGGGPLRDSVIHFGENLPEHSLEEGARRSAAASLNLVIGSSLLVRPASSLPFEGQSPVAIVAMTCTGSDLKALRRGGVLVHAPADVVIERIMHHLGLAHFANAPALMSALHQRVRERDEAVLRSDGDIPYDGGADGGVVPDALASRPQRAQAAPPASVAATLRLRQTHAALEDGKHRWSLCLESVDMDGRGGAGASPGGPLSLVRGVRFELHPTFEPMTYDLRAPPFHVGPFIGWGTFDVKVDIDLGGGVPGVTTSFPLSFRRDEKILPVVAAA